MLFRWVGGYGRKAHIPNSPFSNIIWLPLMPVAIPSQDRFPICTNAIRSSSTFSADSLCNNRCLIRIFCHFITFSSSSNILSSIFLLFSLSFVHFTFYILKCRFKFKYCFWISFYFSSGSFKFQIQFRNSKWILKLAISD